MDLPLMDRTFFMAMVSVEEEIVQKSIKSTLENILEPRTNRNEKKIRQWLHWPPTMCIYCQWIPSLDQNSQKVGLYWEPQMCIMVRRWTYRPSATFLVQHLVELLSAKDYERDLRFIDLCTVHRQAIMNSACARYHASFISKQNCFQV